MPTEKQIDANRRNARRSTGPRTPAGKAISSQNALKHGLRARSALLPTEDKQDFDRLFNDFRAAYHPAGCLEELLVEQMSLAWWKLSRLTRFESHFYQNIAADPSPDPLNVSFGLNHELDPLQNEPKCPPDHVIARALMRDYGHNPFASLSCYEMRLERSFYRALRELERLRASRAPTP